MTRVKIKNFQSLKSVDFEINGFTVIVGRNNIGKSAVIRAVDAALTNLAGKDYIRRGEKETEVQIDSGGLKIIWKKGESSTYKINGESYSKLNRTIPQPMADAGFGRLDIGDQKISPYIAHQFEPLFLLDKPGSVVTEVLASLYNLNILSKADDLCQKELKGHKNILKTRETDLLAIKEKLDKFKGFDDIKNTVLSLIDLENNCDILKKEIDEINTYINILSGVSININKLKPIKTIKIPETIDAANLVPEVDYITKKNKELDDLLGRLNTLKKISYIKPPVITDLNEQIKEIKELETYNTILQNMKEKLIKYKDLNFINTDRVKKEVSVIDGYIKDYNDIKNIEESFIPTASTAKSTRTELSRLSEQLDSIKTELGQFTTCPACGGPL